MRVYKFLISNHLSLALLDTIFCGSNISMVLAFSAILSYTIYHRQGTSSQYQKIWIFGSWHLILVFVNQYIYKYWDAMLSDLSLICEFEKIEWQHFSSWCRCLWAQYFHHFDFLSLAPRFLPHSDAAPPGWAPFAKSEREVWKSSAGMCHLASYPARWSFSFILGPGMHAAPGPAMAPGKIAAPDYPCPENLRDCPSLPYP